MVSNSFESKMSWRPVAKPGFKPSITNARKAPPTQPKPQGNVLVYVYETPGVPPVEYQMPVTANGSFQPDSQSIANVHSEQENKESILESSDVDRRMKRIKNRAEEAGEGYKLLADVDPSHSKSSSRGGQMFLKQRKRMQNYTSSESMGKVNDDADDMLLLDDQELEVNVSSPWNLPKRSSANKYNPESIFNNFSRKRSRKNQIISPLRSPPPEWRAKVESAYTYPADTKKPIRRWNSVDENRKTSSRSGSAPPLTSDDTIEREKSKSVIGVRNENVSTWNDRRAAGRIVLATAPYIQYDFNARPVGWSRSYATQY